MAVVQDYYQNRRDLGPPAVVAYLDAWLSERAGMNKALLAAENERTDPAKLAEQEARIRRAIADLVGLKEKGAQATEKQASDLAGKHLEGAWKLAVANAAASSRKAAALIGAEGRLAETQARYRKRVADDLTVKDPDTLEIIATTLKEVPPEAGGAAAAAQVTRPNGQAGVLGTRVDDLIRKAGSDPSKRDAIVSEVIAQYGAAGDDETVRALTERYAPGAPSWDVYMAKRHPDFTAEEHKAVLDEMKRVRAGGSSAEPVALYEKLAEAGEGKESTSTETTRVVPGVDPAKIDDQIAELEKAADDLADQRRAGGLRRRFPRPNYMIANPNTYTDPRYMREAKAWGVMDPRYVEEVEGEIERTGTLPGAVRAIAGRGGLSQSNALVPAELLTDDTDETVWRVAEQWGSRKGTTRGGQPYTLNDDGTVTVAGKTYKPGDKEHEAVVAEVYNVPLPDAVSGLYAPSRALAAAGRWDDAESRARFVDPNDVRSGYAQAIRDVTSGKAAFSGVPKEQQVAVLAETMGGKAGEHMRALLSQPMADTYATRRVVSALGSLADAMDAAPEIEARKGAERAREQKMGRAEVAAGKMLSEDYVRGRAQAEDVVGRLRALDPNPETLRAKINAYGGAFDSAKSDFDRGVVEAINDATQATVSPMPVRSAPMLRTDVAARPSESEPLKLGATRTPTVKAPDLALEQGGVADGDYPGFDAFMTSAAATKPGPDPDADFDDFMVKKTQGMK